MKGGTAINLFVRDMPRLSVDLVIPAFVDHRPERDEALARINEGIRGAVDRLKTRGFQTSTQPSVADAGETKLFVCRDKLEVKIGVNFVTRGTVHPVRPGLTHRRRHARRCWLTWNCLWSRLEDLYGGKLVAAMDRQHPRDLFDVMQLFQHEGITPGIHRCFVVYLASHNRPMNPSKLAPTLRDISGEFAATFRGMTAEPIELKPLLLARDE